MLSEPTHDSDSPFLMAIEDVFWITGRGTIVTGVVERGIVKPGDPIEIVGFQAIGETMQTIVSGVERFYPAPGKAMPDRLRGVLVKRIDHHDIRRGMVLATPGSISAHQVFDADVAISTANEGGPASGLASGARPQVLIRTADVIGLVSLLDGETVTPPGESARMRVTLNEPIAMQIGDDVRLASERSTIYMTQDQRQTFAVGTITTLLD